MLKYRGSTEELQGIWLNWFLLRAKLCYYRGYKPSWIDSGFASSIIISSTKSQDHGHVVKLIKKNTAFFNTQTTAIKEWGGQKELGGTGKGHFIPLDLLPPSVILQDVSAPNTYIGGWPRRVRPCQVLRQPLHFSLSLLSSSQPIL